MKPLTWIKRAALACAATAACAGVAAVTSGPATQPFADPLDTAAVRSPLAARALINGLAQAGTRLVAVGQRGHIVYSDDGGAHWSQAAVPLASDLVAVQFPTPELGWAVGHDGVVLHSVDGGASWSKQLDGRAAAAIADEQVSKDPNATDAQRADAKRMVEQGPDKPFLDVWFEDRNSGYVVGAFNLIFHTADGGRTWQSWADRTDNPSAFHLNAIRAVGGDLYIVGEQGLVLRLNRERGRFEAMATPYKGTYFGLAGKDGALLVYGLRGNAYRSTDRGASWSKVETGLQVGLTASALAQDGRLLLVSQAGQVLVSADAGATFTRLPGAPGGPVSTALAAGGQLVLGGVRGLRQQPLAAH
ncbi:glycosyl hydrolase [Duganella sp. LX20W]|uniref:Glycosyl hydrolase n=1 Tax=Rugamonas brunnea TaxID=2758569 RepID=A0A7W2EX39_9BURK|nr:YCF48-related protein [Rugamonas brunnea]MBA5640165.1 glycosyl hydrolase [Rugamonas brunnea]